MGQSPWSNRNWAWGFGMVINGLQSALGKLKDCSGDSVKAIVLSGTLLPWQSLDSFLLPQH